MGSLSDPDDVQMTVVPAADVRMTESSYDKKGLSAKEMKAVFDTPRLDAVAASGMSEDDDPEMPPFVLVDHIPGMSFVSRMDPELKRYWLSGPGAAKVGWGTPGSFTRCVSNLRKYFPQNPEGLCANLYHEATGHWPGEDRDK